MCLFHRTASYAPAIVPPKSQTLFHCSTTTRRWRHNVTAASETSLGFFVIQSRHSLRVPWERDARSSRGKKALVKLGYTGAVWTWFKSVTIVLIVPIRLLMCSFCQVFIVANHRRWRQGAGRARATQRLNPHTPPTPHCLLPCTVAVRLIVHFRAVPLHISILSYATGGNFSRFIRRFRLFGSEVGLSLSTPNCVTIHYFILLLNFSSWLLYFVLCIL